MDTQEVARIITTALAEDIGKGDITSALTIPEGATASFSIATREDIIVCGVDIAKAVFTHVDNTLTLTLHHTDGENLASGTKIISGTGNARSILAAERVALNLMQRLCGIATQTRHYVNAIAGTNATLLDTRKTTPGLREMEKYAVTIGGGQNHRFRLDDAILIKDNHISIAGSVSKAVALAKAGAPASMLIEVECDTLEQVQEALGTAADVIMLDNMTPEQMREAVTLVGGKVKLEASGNVNLTTIKAIVETGVDFISVGKLTHSVKSADIGLDMR